MVRSNGRLSACSFVEATSRFSGQQNWQELFGGVTRRGCSRSAFTPQRPFSVALIRKGHERRRCEELFGSVMQRGCSRSDFTPQRPVGAACIRRGHERWKCFRLLSRICKDSWKTLPTETAAEHQRETRPPATDVGQTQAAQDVRPHGSSLRSVVRRSCRHSAPSFVSIDGSLDSLPKRRVVELLQAKSFQAPFLRSVLPRLPGGDDANLIGVDRLSRVPFPVTFRQRDRLRCRVGHRGRPDSSGGPFEAGVVRTDATSQPRTDFITSGLQPVVNPLAEILPLPLSRSKRTSNTGIVFESRLPPSFRFVTQNRLHVPQNQLQKRKEGTCFFLVQERKRRGSSTAMGGVMYPEEPTKPGESLASILAVCSVIGGTHSD